MAKSKKRSKRVTDDLCSECPSLCCHALVMPIDKPRTRDGIEELKWHVQYDTVSAFIQNRRWHLLVEGGCQYLDKHNLCKRYETRPDRCRRHRPPDCEFYGSFYDVMLHTPEEVEEYFRKERERSRRRRAKRTAS